MHDPIKSAIVGATAENLRFAIADHQETIRATDLKAEVVGILLTVLISILAWKGGIGVSGVGHWFNFAAVLAALAAAICVGGVLWPRADPWKKVTLGPYKPTRVLYPSKDFTPGQSIDTRAALAMGTDWVCELTYELAKLSIIRDSKTSWFRAAVLLGGFTVLTIAVGLFWPATTGG